MRRYEVKGIKSNNVKSKSFIPYFLFLPLSCSYSFLELHFGKQKEIEVIGFNGN